MNYDEIKSKNLFSHPHSIAFEFVTGFEYPWEVIPHIADFIVKLGNSLPKDEYEMVGNNVWVSRTAQVAKTASITGPCIICSNAQIRHCAFIRGNAIIGESAVVGNSTELKNCILFDRVQVPHYNYVGDSILGYSAHMGAGSITSNVKSDKSEVFIDTGRGKIPTGRKKLGAILGDFAEIGCGAVLNPGTVIGSSSTVYPLSCVRGIVLNNHIYKSQDNIVTKN